MVAHRARVLIVDVDVQECRRTGRPLERAGYSCVCAHSAAEALERARASTLDAVILELRIGEQSGLDCLSLLQSSQAHIAPLVYTAHPSLETAVAAMRMGVMDYLVKGDPTLPMRLREALVRAEALSVVGKLEGGLRQWADWMSQSQLEMRRLRDQALGKGERAPRLVLDRSVPGLASLSDREREIVGLLREGLPNREIAAALYISEHTVKNHLKAVFRKLDVSSRAELIAKL